MNEPFDEFAESFSEQPLSAHETDLAPPAKKGQTLLAWLVILGFAGFVVGASPRGEDLKGAAGGDSMPMVLFDLQLRYLVGAQGFVPPEQVIQQARGLARNEPDKLLRVAIVAGDVAGPNEALKELNGIEGDLSEYLRTLYLDYQAGNWAAPSVTDEQRADIRNKLGWLGDLALAPRNQDGPAREAAFAPAFETFVAMFSTVLSVCFLGFGGLVGLIVFLILLAKGKLESGILTGSRFGGVYAETFAVWLALLLGFGFVLSLTPVAPLQRSGAAFAASMLALLWPMVRGIPRQQMFEDIGWTTGRNLLLEPMLGVVCYVMALPIVCVGFLITLLLLVLTRGGEALGLGLANQDMPIHPIVRFIVEGDTASRIVVFLLACVAAPIVEETMFRGVLYRHLRELTGNWAWFWSFVVSTLVVSFVFAAIHPQGLVTVPALMGLAIGFSIAREWRGSLIAPMVGHALNNGLVLMFVILVMGK